MFHEKTQTNDQLYNRLCPFVKEENKRFYSPILLRRLEKLGLSPDKKLEPAEIEKLVRLNIDPSTISWNRVLDVNDRFLREITVGQSPTEKGFARSTNFDITVASEIMAVLGIIWIYI
jgi:formyltetrahydrofolate synthetase